MFGTGSKLLLVGLLLSGRMVADEWTFFHADQVKTYSCTTTGPVALIVNGASFTKDVWQSDATAVYVDGTSWHFVVGQFNYNKRGKHMAEKACEKWHDEAEIRVRRAH